MFDPLFTELEFYSQDLELNLVEFEWLRIIKSIYQFDDTDITKKSIVLSNNEVSNAMPIIKISFFEDHRIVLSFISNEIDETVRKLIFTLRDLVGSASFSFRRVIVSGFFDRKSVERLFKFNLEGLTYNGYNTRFEFVTEEGNEWNIRIMTRENKNKPTLLLVSDIKIADNQHSADIIQSIHSYQHKLKNRVNTFLNN